MTYFSFSLEGNGICQFLSIVFHCDIDECNWEKTDRGCGCKKDTNKFYFLSIVKCISLFTVLCILKLNFIGTEMDVSGRRQTEAVVAAAADYGQTKLQVVVMRRLHHCVMIWMISTALFWQFIAMV